MTPKSIRFSIWRWLRHKKNAGTGVSQVADGIQSKPQVANHNSIDSDAPVLLRRLPEGNKANPPYVIGDAEGAGFVNKYNWRSDACAGVHNSNASIFRGTHFSFRQIGLPYFWCEELGKFTPYGRKESTPDKAGGS